MIVGFNHNISYQGVGYHVQTEDGGLKKPQLVTLLYHGGTIIASQKTSYSDILKVDDLPKVVEELAKEQHKGMLKRLNKGEFDQRILDMGIKPNPAEAKSGDSVTVQDVLEEQESLEQEEVFEELDEIEGEDLLAADADDPFADDPAPEVKPDPVSTAPRESVRSSQPVAAAQRVAAPDPVDKVAAVSLPVEKHVPAPAVQPAPAPQPMSVEPAFEPEQEPVQKKPGNSLDDLIFSYLSGGDRKK